MTFRDEGAILRQYPRLKSSSYSGHSDPDDFYNCIAFAVGDRKRWWEPFRNYLYTGGLPVWPEGCSAANTLPGWIEAFHSLRFERCDDGNFERGFERIAIFGLSESEPKHVAWQPSDRNGDWYSKLGNDADIRHEDVLAVSDEDGSQVLAYMKRDRHHRSDQSLLRCAKPLEPLPTRVPTFQ